VRLRPAARFDTVWRAIEIAKTHGTLNETTATLLLGNAFFRAYGDLEIMTGNEHASLPGAEREPSSDEVRAALQRLIASEAFRASKQLAIFLRFVVEAKLRGEGRRIKEYTIAVEVLGRGEGFDGRFDPIVRVEAGRLRRALERYYAADGAKDPVLIDIPRGHYIPEFRYRQIVTGTTTRPTSIAEALLHLRKWLSK
jgi:hypothetical protein